MHRRVSAYPSYNVYRNLIVFQLWFIIVIIGFCDTKRAHRTAETNATQEQRALSHIRIQNKRRDDDDQENNLIGLWLIQSTNANAFADVWYVFQWFLFISFALGYRLNRHLLNRWCRQLMVIYSQWLVDFPIFTSISFISVAFLLTQKLPGIIIARVNGMK